MVFDTTPPVITISSTVVVHQFVVASNSILNHETQTP
jgi:hypothetical protein